MAINYFVGYSSMQCGMEQFKKP